MESMRLKEPHHVEEHLVTRHLGSIVGDAEDITCPLCIPQFTGVGKIARIIKYGQESYIEHYRSDHQSSVCAITAFNEYGTSGRIYEAFVLYIACLTERTRLNGPDPELEINPVRKYDALTKYFVSSTSKKGKDKKAHGEQSKVAPTTGQPGPSSSQAGAAPAKDPADPKAESIIEERQLGPEPMQVESSEKTSDESKSEASK